MGFQEAQLRHFQSECSLKIFLINGQLTVNWAGITFAKSLKGKSKGIWGMHWEVLWMRQALQPPSLCSVPTQTHNSSQNTMFYVVLSSFLEENGSIRRSKFGKPGWDRSHHGGWQPQIGKGISSSPSITAEEAFLGVDNGCQSRHHHLYKAVVQCVGFEVRHIWRQAAGLGLHPNPTAPWLLWTRVNFLTSPDLGFLSRTHHARVFCGLNKIMHISSLGTTSGSQQMLHNINSSLKKDGKWHWALKEV